MFGITTYTIVTKSKTNLSFSLFTVMIKTKVAFLEGRFLTSQSKQFEKYSKSSDWLEKIRPSEKATFVLINRLIYYTRCITPKHVTN